MAISAKDRQRVRMLAKELVEITGGRFDGDGKPKTFDDIENEATEIGDLVTAFAMEQLVEQDAELEELPCCPTCGKAGQKRQADDEAMVLQTARGEVQWVTEGYFCRGCRRSFFPSVG